MREMEPGPDPYVAKIRAFNELPTGERRMTFNEFFKPAYAKLEGAIAEVIHDDQDVLDIGAGSAIAEGFIAKRASRCNVVCVENDPKMVEFLKLKFSPPPKRLRHDHIVKSEMKGTVVEMDANKYLTQNEQANTEDLVILNATLHEMCDPDKKDEYLDFLFNSLKTKLRPGGRLIIGDYYYYDKGENAVSDEEFEQFMKIQIALAGHADQRDKFLSPEQVEQKAQEHEFKTQRFKMIRAAREVDRKYYLFVFENMKLQ